MAGGERVGSLVWQVERGWAPLYGRWDWYGFGNANNSFWCCYGSSVESFAKLGDSIFFTTAPNASAHNAVTPAAANSLTATSATAGVGRASSFKASSPPPRSLIVAQYIPSVLSFPDAGIGLSLDVSLDLSPVGKVPMQATLRVNISFAAASTGSPTGSPTGSTTGLDLRVRIPGWCRTATVRVYRGANCTEHSPQAAGAQLYAVPSPKELGTGGGGWGVGGWGGGEESGGGGSGWAAGDSVHLWLGMAPRLQKINDGRPDYANVASIMLGHGSGI